MTIQQPASSIQDRPASDRAARLLERLAAIWPRLCTGAGADASWAGSRPLAVDEEHQRVTVLARPGVLLVGHPGAFDRALSAATKRTLRHSEWQYPAIRPTVTAADLLAALAAVPPTTEIVIHLWSHAELPEPVLAALLPARLDVVAPSLPSLPSLPSAP